MLTKPKLLIFDVNETLLNMQPLKSKVNFALKNDFAFAIWFSTLLHYSLVESVSQRYRSFSAIAAATFEMVSQQFNVSLTPADIQNILSTITKLPAHPDVAEGLTNLKLAQYKIAALTNGDLKVAEAQLNYAGIRPYFDMVLSVESVGYYKPHPNAYAHALKTMNCAGNDAMMIAAHGWDIMGAQQAGIQSCFIARPSQFQYPLVAEADLTCSDLIEVARVLAA
ncbi:haloacid dehalogenase type II [Arenibacter sp. GZD96]|uniref:haloacid dehalogenase type II n=1 Tax=Aurantibrevibacter litoralis TaxID=3106030 RepID=UPI002AFE3EB8|nr:haloacid dehalogenase type II [Arenibacter sp. GZD-96]MEA1785355.1 haloacid dehalogenase type II [Arenibacter sp. GZD-96]